MAQALELKAERTARSGGKPAADCCAERTAGQRPERSAGERQRLPDDAFQSATDRLPERRPHGRAGRARDLSDQVSEKLIELALVGDREQLGREL